MNFDSRDAATVFMASMGMLLGSLVGIALESVVIIWGVAGLLLGAGLAAYLLS